MQTLQTQNTVCHFINTWSDKVEIRESMTSVRRAALEGDIRLWQWLFSHCKESSKELNLAWKCISISLRIEWVGKFSWQHSSRKFWEWKMLDFIPITNLFTSYAGHLVISSGKARRDGTWIYNTVSCLWRLEESTGAGKAKWPLETMGPSAVSPVQRAKEKGL